MRRLRALLGIDAPPEARFFLAVGAFAAVVDVAYWFVTYEDAGTFLLGGFALAALLMGTRLASSAESRRESRPLPPFVGGFAPGDGGTAHDDPQRPFLDESGRLPTPTFAPFALAMGVAVAATSLVFGPAPLLVGAIPMAWGAWRWLTGASAELVATESGEAERAAAVSGDSPPSQGSAAAPGSAAQGSPAPGSSAAAPTSAAPASSAATPGPPGSAPSADPSPATPPQP